MKLGAPVPLTRRSPSPDAERGAVLIMVGIMLVVLVLAAAIAVDLTVHGRRGEDLQNATDAATLAGAAAWVRTGDPELAIDAADELLLQNGVNPQDDDIEVYYTFPTVSQMRVEVYDTTNPPLFGSITSSDSVIVRDSTAELDICANSCVTELEVPPPFTDIQALGSGDGWIPIPIGDRIFAVNHREIGTYVVCVNNLSEICPGYPIASQPDRWQAYVPNNPHVGQTIYTLSQATDGLWMGCFDTAAGTSCGADRLYTAGPGNSGVNDSQRGGALIEVDGELFAFLDNRTVACRNLDLSDCAGGASFSDDTGLPVQDVNWTSGANGSSIALGDRIYFTTHFTGQAANSYGTQLHCIDAGTKTTCSGWTQTRRIGSSTDSGWWGWAGRLFYWRDTVGNPTLICSTITPDNSALQLYCFDLITGAPTNPPGSEAADYIANYGTDHYRIGFGSVWHEPTNREIINTGSGDDLNPGDLAVCWDWETKTGCGTATTTIAGGARTYGYGYLPGSNCIYALGDFSWFWTFYSPSDSPLEQDCRGGTASVTIYPCTCVDGTKHWGAIEIDTDITLAGPYEEFEVLVTAPNGDEWDFGNLVGTGDSAIDLSGIPTTHNSLLITVSVEAKLGQDPWSSGNPPGINVGWIDKPRLVE